MRPIVFDFDGVLARSMEQHARAYAEVLEPLGVTVSEREVLLREGARSETIIADLLGPDTDHDIGALADKKQAAFEAMGLPHLYPGAADLVDWARAQTDALGLVTGTRRRNLERLIPNLLPKFDAVLTQEDYTHDKPHPEPYARAAEALGAEPSRCIAVENAIRGIESARAADYGTVLAICTTLSAEDLSGAGPDGIAADHDAMAALIDAAVGAP